MNRKEILEMGAEKALKKEIRNNGGDGEVFENLEYLTTYVEKFGEKMFYLPLQMKKLLCTMLDADYRIEYSVRKDASFCEVIAKLYWSDKETCSGTGYVKRYLSQIAPMDSLTSEERDALMEATCRGLAASRAITDAGIGQQLFGETAMDDFKEETETADVQKSLDMKMSNVVPQPKSANEKKAERYAKKAETVQTPTQEKVEREPEQNNEQITLPMVDADISDTTPEVPMVQETVTISSSTMSYLEAAAQIADKGSYKGNTLGDIYKANPRNLIWLVNNKSAVSEAAKAIILSDSELASKLR